MNTQQQASFIHEKIKQLETAILYCHSNSVLKLPSAIVHAQHIDEAGCVWVAMTKPMQYVHEFDRSFHTALNFYRKGAPFYLNALGLARVVIDPEEINLLPGALTNAHQQGKLILCVRILEANYFEQPSRPEQGFLNKCRNIFSSIFADGNEFYY